MKVAIRVDASIQIGSGHVARCLTLAAVLRQAGAEVLFLCRDHPGHMGALIENQGFSLALLPATAAPAGEGSDLAHAAWLGSSQMTDAEQCQAALQGFGRPDWLIVDHYALDARWQRRLRSEVGRILVIDDLADRDHACDLLLDQNLGREAGDYEGRVPAGCQVLCGPHYALLRPEFAALREQSLQRHRSAPRQVLITLGGVDQDNVTGQVLSVLQGCNLPQDMQVTVIMGATAPHVEEVRRQARTMVFQCEVVVAVSDMAERMVQADLSIGAAGSTTWERACLGLPSLIVVLAENQTGIAQAISEAGAALYAGKAAEADFPKQLRRAVLQCLSEPGLLSRMGVRAAAIVDGVGASRVQLAMQGEIQS
ncbi:probable polysaccharide biosynthesis protein [Roseobacter sp. SK209-2-6]|nr:probable polysaccharide biosynthesis protein [Roseobacter sp. SK209-2-6]